MREARHPTENGFKKGNAYIDIHDKTGRRSPYSAFQVTTICYQKCAYKGQPFILVPDPSF